MKKNPLVSILVNCYNGEKYLKQAIDSVLGQTYKNWEIIFWDNQSTDNSGKIFNQYTDNRLKYYYAPEHTWLYEARNYAMEKANGEIIAFLDVDDLWLSNKLEKQVPLFSDPQVGMICSNYWIKHEQKKKKWKAFNDKLPSGWVLNDLLKSYFVGLLTLMISRKALDSLTYKCDPRYHVMGDLDLVVRLSFNWKLENVNEPLAICRKHGDNELEKHRSRHVNELELWISEFKDLEKIKFASNFHFLEINYAYQKAMDLLLKDKKNEVFPILSKLPIGIMKLRLFFAILLPISILRYLKN